MKRLGKFSGLLIAALALIGMISACKPNLTRSDGTAIVYVKTIVLSATSTTMLAGATRQITATLTPTSPDNATLSWSSSNTAVAKVSSSGLVTGVALGTATITASATDGSKVTGTIKVTVAADTPATSVTLSNSTLSLNTQCASPSYTLTATLPSASTDYVTWTSSDTSVATVSSSGVVTSLAAGTATITAAATDSANDTVRSGVDATCAVTVVDNSLIAEYQFTSANTTVSGSTSTIANTLGYSNGTSMTVADDVTNTSNAAFLESYTDTNSVTKNAIQWPTGTSGATEIGGNISGILPSSATGLTYAAWVSATSDWSNSMKFTDGTNSYYTDLPNLTVYGIGNIWPGGSANGTDYGDVTSGHAWSDFINLGWVYATIVIDSSAGSVSFYVNGSLVVQYTGLTAETAAMIANAQTGTFTIGENDFTDPLTYVSGVRIYNGALTAAQVLSLYNSNP